MKLLINSELTAAFCWLLVVLLVNDCFAQEAQFTNLETGRISWVIESSALPWTGAYYFRDGETDPTRLLSVVDSSNGVKLAECKANNTDDGWRRFFWELGIDYLLCNVSDATVQRIPIEATNSQSFSVRILAKEGPRCLRDLIVQNERSRTCPPILRRNNFQYAAFVCGCNATNEEKDHSEVSSSGIIFPLFKLQKTPAPYTEAPSTVSSNNLNNQLSTMAPMFPSVNISNFIQQKHLSTASPASVTPATTFFPMVTITDRPKNPCDSYCKSNELCFVNDENEPVCLDACSTMLCMNGGECEIVDNAGVCKCQPGFTGTLCEKAIECKPSCENNGTCIVKENESVCDCKDGFIGINCNVIDSCADKSTCAMFGDESKCIISEYDNSPVYGEAARAKHECLCPDSQGNMVNCLSLFATAKPSIAPTRLPTPAVALMTTTFVAPVESSSEVTQLFTTPKTDEITATDYSTTVESELPTEAITTIPIYGRTDLPLTGHNIYTPLFPFSSLPTLATTVPSIVPEITTAEAVSEQNGHYTTTVLTPVGSLDRPTNLLHSFNNMTRNRVDQNPYVQTESSEIRTTDDELHTVEVTTEGYGNSAEAVEFTTVDSMWTKTTLSHGWSAEATMQPHPMWPETTIHSFWPEINVAVTTSVDNIDATSMPENVETSTEDKISEVVTEAETVNYNSVTLPPWMKQLTTEKTNEHLEHVTEEVTAAAVTAPDNEHANTVADELTTETEPETTALPTKETITEAAVRGNQLNRKLGKGKGTSRSSSSWIVAMVAILTLLMLLGAAGLFVLRYVKRSRKLHGKYNPAREENALSSNYSMPMTTVPKEERLI
uniref:EGF-like domain-containing protein n=1 Tax=Syphacia muris TaxID=451379 RepID=A0A0N5ANP7_9BILA